MADGQSAFSPGWSMVSETTRRLAMAINNTDPDPIIFQKANWPAQEELITRAQAVVEQLDNLGIVLLNGNDADLQATIAKNFLKLLSDERE